MITKLDRRDLLIALLLGLVTMGLLLPVLGSYPLLSSWEPHYGEVAREMLHRGNWWDPVYRGGRFWSKPIGEFWLVIPSFALFGISDLTARLPNAIVGILGVIIAYLLLRKLLGSRRSSILAVLVLMTTPYYDLISRQLMVDIPYVVSFFIAMLLFTIAFFVEYRLTYILLAWACLGIVMLFKGLLAIVLPGSIFFIYIMATWDWSIVRKAKLHLGIPLFLLVAGPWHVYMTVKHGTPFLQEWFIQHHFERMAGDLDKPNATFALYVRDLAYGFFPWIALLPAGIVGAFSIARQKVNSRTKIYIMLLLSCLVPYLLFSYAQTKFHHYIFPAVPFAAVIVGLFLDRMLSGPYDLKAKVLLVISALILAVVGADLLTGMNYKNFVHLITVQRVQDWFGPLGDPRPALAGAVMCWSLFLLLSALWNRGEKKIVPAIIIPIAWAATGLGAARCAGTSWTIASAVAGGAGLVSLFFSIKFPSAVSTIGISALIVSSAVVTGQINFRTVPEMLRCFSAKSLVRAYMKLKKGNEPLATYNSWKTRDTTYYLPLNYPWTRAEQDIQIKRFVKRNKGRRYFIQVPKANYQRLKNAVKDATLENLYIVADDRYKSFVDVYLVSNRRGSAERPKPGIDLLDKIPENLTARTDATLGGKVELIGYRISSTSVKPGGTFRLELFYKVLAPLGDDYMIFVHADRVKPPFRRTLSDHVPAQGRHPTFDWKPGQIVRDETVLTIGGDWPAGQVEIFTGLFKGPNRLPVDQLDKQDGHNRVRLLKITVE
ncbi:MAG: glycosyltransferase family 39 protein [Deltaproteobacteria bacterium]|nr:glycosyltransferase family 39 protein [Deltaproteobacteria bacterium]